MKFLFVNFILKNFTPEIIAILKRISIDNSIVIDEITVVNTKGKEFTYKSLILKVISDY